MPVNVLRWLTVGAWLVWFAFYWGTQLRVLKEDRDALGKGSRLDRLLAVSMGVAVLGLFGGVLATAGGVAGAPQGWPMVLLGTLVAWAGLLLAFHCRRVLGRFWTGATRVREGHLVIDEGPYGIVRHPIYTATLTMFLGSALACSTATNWLLLAASVVLYALKALDEERFLSAQLAPAYQGYKARVRYRLVPGVW